MCDMFPIPLTDETDGVVFVEPLRECRARGDSIPLTRGELRLGLGCAPPGPWLDFLPAEPAKVGVLGVRGVKEPDDDDDEAGRALVDCVAVTADAVLIVFVGRVGDARVGEGTGAFVLAGDEVGVFELLTTFRAAR